MSEIANSPAVWELIIAFNLPTQWRSKREEQEGTRASGSSPWKHISTYLIQPFKNAVLSKNLDQNMPKNAYFGKKAATLPRRQGLGPHPPLTSGRWGHHPRPPHCYFRLQLSSSVFRAFNVFYYFEK